MTHYIPRKEDEFLDWSENLITVSEAHAADWNLVQSKVAGLRTLHNEFKRLHLLCKTPIHTKVDMEEKNEKMAELLGKEEVFVRNNLQNNDFMTDVGRVELQIPIHDTNRTPGGKPGGIPDIEVETPMPRTLRLRFRALNALRWGKPEDAHGLECLWGLFDTPPQRVGDLPHSAFSTATPLDLVFEEDQRGKRIYFAVRWKSSTSKEGTWSEIFSAFVP
ncbi:hypothetical protein FACS1894200_11990 [Spirochaetia bacterium]|nr:hypothetical protein FACS1894200_11990 [Spirochaetia bacterium]